VAAASVVPRRGTNAGIGFAREERVGVEEPEPPSGPSRN
jgi:hypothetical protein